MIDAPGTPQWRTDIKVLAGPTVGADYGNRHPLLVDPVCLEPNWNALDIGRIASVPLKKFRQFASNYSHGLA